MRKTYYTLPMQISPGWCLPQFADIEKTIVRGVIGTDAPNWGVVPPHVVFANLGYARKRPVPREAGHASVIEVRDFIKQYGVIGIDVLVVEQLEPGDQFQVSTLLFGYMQDSFRVRWRSGKASDVWFPLGGEETNSFSVPFTRGKNGFDLRPSDLFTYMQFLLARDLDEKTAGFCKNPDCVAPFFVGRRGKACCSRRCASDRCVKRWRKNAARRSR